MKKRLLAITLILALMTAFLPSSLSVQATPPEWAPRGRPEQLEPGWQRIDPHTKVHTLRTFTNAQGKKFAEVEAVVSSLPATLKDNRTLIDTNWYLLSDQSGQTWFQTGVNLFTARVLGGRVSVEDENGRLSVWDPRVTIAGTTFSGGTAQITNDPLNENYEGNVLKWEYGSYNNGWWIFGTTATVERYLRVIEGHISETWILPIDPKASVYIDLNESVEADYGAHITWLSAYDADGMPLEVTKNKLGWYVINASEFSDKTFPVTIDPTESFNTSSYDASIWNLQAPPYSATRTATEGYVHQTTLGIGQALVGGAPFYDYMLYRSAVYFNTAGIPDNAVVTSSTLDLRGYDDDSATDFYIVVRSGGPTYPHLPPVVGDYYYLNYAGNGGQFWTGGFSTTSYNSINLNATGMSWINLTGWTKFMLHSSKDISGTTPTGYEIVYCRTFEYGTGYYPKLNVTYYVPIVAPTVTTITQTNVSETSALLKGYLNDDGNEPCSVRFYYNEYGGGAQYTAWVGGYTTGSYFNTTVYGLTPGKRIAYYAQASNSHSTDDGYELKFMTYPYVPTSFSATGEENQIALAWTKGTGAQKTMVRRAEGSYPATPTSGTQIYFDTGSNHDDTTTVNGTTYYYSAWSYSTEDSLEAYSQYKATDYAESYELSTADVTTNDATDVTTTTATLNLYLNDLGGYATTDVSFQYHPDGGNWGDYSTTPTQKTAPGGHSAGVVSLTIDTLYHVRAKATNTAGTVYGSDVPFTTNAPSAPTMLTQAATGVQLTSVTLNGKVSDDGDALVTVWFQYGLTTEYEMGSTPSASGLETNDTFYYNLGNLLPATTYHFRAVGENTAGIGYGDDAEFETATPTAPALNTNEATEVGSNQATLRGTLTSDGGVACEVRFQWGTTVGYGTDSGWQPGYTTGMNFDTFITDLTVGETYHFRAQAKNAGGTTDGADKQFTTKFTPPVDFTCKAISSNTITSEWVKAGDQTYIRYKQVGFPVDREDGIPVYFGPGETTSISGLMPGVTYYFRAWSWREGNVWAEGYSQDVATTSPTVAGATEERPQGVVLIDEFPGWLQTPSGSALTKLPFYDAGVATSESIGMPEGSFWLLSAIFLTIIAGVVTLCLPNTNHIAAVVVGGIVFAGLSVLGMAPMWFIVIYVVISGGLIFTVKRGIA